LELAVTDSLAFSEDLLGREKITGAKYSCIQTATYKKAM